MAFPFLALIPVVGKLLDKLIPDPQAAANAKIEMLKLAQNGELAFLDADVKLATGQMEVNKAEAQSGSFFRGGWRPATGWVCVAGFVYMTLLRPLLPWLANVAGAGVPPLPPVDTTEMIALLFGMLGLGGMRSAERIKGKV